MKKFTFGIVLVWKDNTRYKHYGEFLFESLEEARLAMDKKIAEYKKNKMYVSVTGRALQCH